MANRTEYWIVLIAGSLPPLRPLFARVVSSIETTFSKVSSKRNGYPSSSEPSKTFIQLKDKPSWEWIKRSNQRKGVQTTTLDSHRGEGSQDAMVTPPEPFAANSTAAPADVEIGVAREFSVTAEKAKDEEAGMVPGRRAHRNAQNHQDLGLPEFETVTPH